MSEKRKATVPAGRAGIGHDFLRAQHGCQLQGAVDGLAQVELLTLGICAVPLRCAVARSYSERRRATSMSLWR